MRLCHTHLYHVYDRLHHDDKALQHLAALGKDLAPHYLLQFHTSMTGTAMAIQVFASYQIYALLFARSVQLQLSQGSKFKHSELFLLSIK